MEESGKEPWAGTLFLIFEQYCWWCPLWWCLSTTWCLSSLSTTPSSSSLSFIVLVLIILISMMIVRELCKSFKTPFPFHHASWNPICDQCKEPATGCKSILCWWQSPSFVSIPCLHPLLAFLCALHTLAPAGHSSLISAMIETMETSHPIQVIF